MTNEDLIRDQLSINLDLIEKNLTLIEKEFKLKNYVGSKGFVDILSKDVYGNFVIIEIKRTRASSRETIQEILKYIGLIKQNFNARDSEIRVIIVSVDWSELLVPFSELLERTSLAVKGYRLKTDISGLPQYCEEVKPLPKVSFQRRFSSSYSIYLFSTDEKRKRSAKEIEDKASELGISDFILLEMNGDKQKDNRLMFKFVLCVALQERPVAECLSILESTDNYVDEEIDFEDKEHELNYFNECLYIQIHEGITDTDGLENGTPESLQQALSSGVWNPGNIYRYGFYRNDPRYDDEILLREIRGLDGKNEQAYLNFCESAHKDRFQEIIEKCQICVKEFPAWRTHIKSIFKFLAKESEPFRLVISIYTPPSILLSLTMTLKTPENYLPTYMIFIDYLEINKTMVFGGAVTWSGNPVDQDGFIQFLQDESGFNFISKASSVVMGDYEPLVFSKLQLKLQNYVVILEQGATKEVGQVSIKKNKIVTTGLDDKELIDWLKAYENLLNRAAIIIQSTTFGLF